MTVATYDVTAETGSARDDGYQHMDATPTAGTTFTGGGGHMYTYSDTNTVTTNKRFRGGMVFRSVIKTPVTITNAQLRIYVYSASYDDIRGEVVCQDENNPQHFDNTAGGNLNMSSAAGSAGPPNLTTARRYTGTAATVTAAYSVGVGAYTLLCNFKAEAQAVMDHPFSGSLMVIFQGDDGAVKKAGYDGQDAGTTAPRLTLTYTDALGTCGPRSVRLRNDMGRGRRQRSRWNKTLAL